MRNRDFFDGWTCLGAFAGHIMLSDGLRMIIVIYIGTYFKYFINPTRVASREAKTQTKNIHQAITPQ